MLKSKIENLKLHLWYYRKSSKKLLLLTDLILLIFASITIIKELNPIYLIAVYFSVYFTLYMGMINFSNIALACTPLKLKDTVCGVALITWINSTLIILISLLFGVINAMLISVEFNGLWLVYILKFAIISYPMLKILCVTLYYISKKDRKLVTYFVFAIFALVCFGLNQLPILLSLISFIAVSVLILFVFRILVKKLTYETIFFKEAMR